MGDERNNRSISDEPSDARSRIRRRRGLKCVSGLNAALSLCLAAALAVMLNYLAFRYVSLRRDISTSQYYPLSDKTLQMLAGLKERIRIVAFVGKSDPLYDDIRFLLREYEHAAEGLPDLALEIELIDPDRDLARTTELVAAYEVDEPNIVVFEAGEKRKYVRTDKLSDYERSVDYQKLLEGKPSVTLRKVGFRGEQIFSSAIFSVADPETKAVYFLSGHGEHAIDDYGEQNGFSGIARIMRRDNIDVQPLLLAESGGIPEKCAAIVIAGPNRKLSQAEMDILSGYLNKNGRILLLLDAGAESGLAPLLERWGVKAGDGVVAGLTLTGTELFITNYGGHPITERLQGVTTMFYRPRAIAPSSEDRLPDRGADRPKVTALALSTKDGWEETDLNQRPPKFDAGQDRIGPVSIAVAVEKGSLQGIDVEIKPTRFVVVGDSDFVSNGALRGGVGGNVDFFMSAVNWLLERETMLGIGAKAPGVLSLQANSRQLRSAFVVIVFGVPGVAGLIGIIVWVRRRR